MLSNFAVPRNRNLAIAAAVVAGAGALFVARTSVAHADGVSEETAFILNTFAFLLWGALVMWMCAGFTMLESGSVRTKNASVICLKNIGIYSIAGLAYFFIGYNLMYGDLIGEFIGQFGFMYGASDSEVALLGGDEAAVSGVIDNGHAKMSDWFFQMVFVATAASIVSGAMAERVKLWSFFPVHPASDRDHLPDSRRVDVGRRLARRHGIHGLRRLYHRA